MIWMMLVSAAALISAIIILCVTIHYRRKISLFSNDLCRILDDMAAENTPDFTVTEDTLDGKINVRLKRLQEILNGKSEQARRDKEKLQALVSDISHQVKAPAANLKLYLELLSRPNLDGEKRREFLQLSAAQAEKLEFLMNALVKMSRLETGLISFEKKKISAADVIAGALAQISPTAEQKNLDMQVNCADGISVFCDQKWTAEAVFNLLDNAVKYTPPNGSIHISTGRNEFYIQVRVRDSGRGISESEQAKIFGRFYRSEAAKAEEGLGLGLFLARNIISGQGGFLSVRSEPSHGAEFTINLPVESKKD